MIRPGLVSITFRQLAPAAIVDLAARAGLAGIEWGADVHVPPGDLARARDAAARTRNAGLAVAAYGSYYRLGDTPPAAFDAVLESAVALATPLIRVWAGHRGSAEADDAYRAAVAADGRRAAERAAAAGIGIVTEWHGGTLTDEADSAHRLFEAVAHPAFRTYWQPRRQTSAQPCLADLQTTLPRLAGLHVFHWDLATGARRPLAEGEADWRRYLARAAAAGDLFALLEFVQDDAPENLLRDAATLCAWLATMPTSPPASRSRGSGGPR